MVVVRDAVSKDIGSVPEIPLADFLKHFMPPPTLTEQELNTVCKKLHRKWRPFEKTFTVDHILAKKTRAKECSAKHAPLMTDKKGQTCWTDYVNTPANRTGGEKAIFGDLADISLQIVACALEVNPNLKRTTKLEPNGSRSLNSEKLNSSMPDGVHRLLAEHGGMFNWDSCACTDEYKLKNVDPAKYDKDALRGVIDVCPLLISLWDLADRTQNSKKIIWNMHHTMRTDCRRRYVLGMSHADTEVRLWQFNRSVVVVSAPFHLNKDACILIDVYSRLAFAALVDLGYDPTIQLCWSLPLSPTAPLLYRQRYYRITVCDTAYITTGIIANQASENGFGRCTRVWRVYEEDDPEKRSYVIKDSWMEAGSTPEFEIYTDLMAAIRAFKWTERCNEPPKKRKHLKKYDSPKPIDPRPTLTTEDRTKFFVKILAGEKVKVDKTVDNTRDVIARGYEIPADRTMYAVWNDAAISTAQGSVHTGVVGNEHVTTYSIPETGRLRGPIVAREHHRSVMEEGKPMNLEDFDVKRIFEIVTDVAYALFILHCVERVHRDISFNNVLEHLGQGVLADLEYVVLQSASDKTCIRTGTADFAAVEVVAGKYTPIDVPKKNWMSVDDAEDASSDDEDAALPAPCPRKTLPPWTYRDVHDLESVWWLALYLLFRHTTDLKVPETYNREAQDVRYSKIFPHYYFSNSEDRTELLKYGEELAEKLELLPPAWTKAMGAHLEAIRMGLTQIYKNTPVGPISPVIWYMVHNMCASGQRIEGKFILNAKDAQEEPTEPADSTIATQQSMDPTLDSVVSIGGKRSHDEALGTNANDAGASVNDAGANDAVANGAGGHDAAGADVGAAEQSQEARTKRRRLRRTNTEPSRRSERLASRSGSGATR
ncbi:hypothetical protein BD626DRAFT_401393 [Schizophyllum amplum]|uniref:Fungal-type protein kinase domain-containing protein n=1 Tax=Schizophyllum amplum TaxID=97359 RepID=A0A550CGD8_9AGAR|nr:hypothetical protein BD626DRAFT_401393 [Auriculariopsis ampla]